MGTWNINNNEWQHKFRMTVCLFNIENMCFRLQVFKMHYLKIGLVTRRKREKKMWGSVAIYDFYIVVAP